MSETELSPEQIDANIATVLAAFEAERTLRAAVPKAAPARRTSRRERRRPLSNETKLRLSEKLRKYNAAQADPENEIQAARIAQQLTQAEAARLARVPRTTFADVESGKSRDVQSIAKVRHVLGLPLR